MVFTFSLNWVCFTVQIGGYLFGTWQIVKYIRITDADIHPIFLKMYHFMSHFMSSLVT